MKSNMCDLFQMMKFGNTSDGPFALDVIFFFLVNPVHMLHSLQLSVLEKKSQDDKRSLHSF